MLAATIAPAFGRWNAQPENNVTPSWLVAVVLLARSGMVAAEDIATLSFSAGDTGALPHSVKAGKTIDVDLSALPKQATIIRAVLRPGRDEREAAQDRLRPVKVLARYGEPLPLPLLPPRFTAFDATAAVKQAREGGRDTIIFEVVSLSTAIPRQAPQPRWITGFRPDFPAEQRRSPGFDPLRTVVCGK